MKKISVALVSILCALNLSAQDISIGLSGSTLGAGVEVTTNITDNLNIRGFVSGLNYSKSVTESDVQYDADLKLMGGGLILDYYPFESGLRLSVGGIYNGTKLSVKGKPTGTSYTINDVTYTTAEVGTLTGAIEYKKLMPYAGIGFANPMKGSAFTFGFDAGAMFGSPSTSLNATGAISDPALADDIAAERQQLENAAGDIKVYPFVNFSLSYRF